MSRLILASASPRRREILEESGYVFTVRVPRIDESQLEAEDAVATARLRAWSKAMALSVEEPDAVILSADTVVEGSDGRVLGKPESASHALELLGLLMNSRHKVVTAVAVGQNGEFKVGIDEAQVTLKPATNEELETYVAGGEPLDKAGALCVQGEGRRFVKSIEGNEDTVVGLPMKTVHALLKADFPEFLPSR